MRNLEKEAVKKNRDKFALFTLENIVYHFKIIFTIAFAISFDKQKQLDNNANDIVKLMWYKVLFFFPFHSLYFIKLFRETLAETSSWPCTRVTICMSYFILFYVPVKVHGTNKSPQTGRTQERSKVDATWPTNLPESSSLESILAEQCVHHQDGPWVTVIGQRQPGNSFYHRKTWGCQPRGRAVLLGSLTLLLFTQAPLSNKASYLLSTCVCLGEFTSKY